MVFMHSGVAATRGAEEAHAGPLQIVNRDPGDVDMRALEIDSLAATSGVTAELDSNARTVEVYIGGVDEITFGPIVFWTDHSGKRPMMIDSVAGVNRVLDRFREARPEIKDSALMSWTISLLRRQYLVEGKETGLTLFGAHRIQLIQNLGKVLSPDKLNDIVHKLEAPTSKIDGPIWSATWVEVDRLGGAERVSASGRVKPWQVRRVAREQWLEAGEIPPEAVNTILGEFFKTK